MNRLSQQIIIIKLHLILAVFIEFQTEEQLRSVHKLRSLRRYSVENETFVILIIFIINIIY